MREVLSSLSQELVLNHEISISCGYELIKVQNFCCRILFGLLLDQALAHENYNKDGRKNMDRSRLWFG
jgi:hypothetical protein